MINSFYDRNELNEMGFEAVGENVLISRKASIYGVEKIRIGNNVRIDDFCILSGRIVIDDYIHIAAYSALYGGEAGISINSFSNISSNVRIYSVSDDYSGNSMTNPMIPDKYKNVINAPVQIKKHVIIGTMSVVMPGVILAEGSAFGAYSFINRSTEPWSINVGIPSKKIRDREKKVLDLEKELLSETS